MERLRKRRWNSRSAAFCSAARVLVAMDIARGERSLPNSIEDSGEASNRTEKVLVPVVLIIFDVRLKSHVVGSWRSSEQQHPRPDFETRRSNDTLADDQSQIRISSEACLRER
jgi:hypothetical protein